MRYMIFLTTILLGFQAAAQVHIPVRVEFGFGGGAERTEYPTAGSRFNHMVSFLDLPEGATRIEFIEEQKGKPVNLPIVSMTADAEVSIGADGKIQFQFARPVAYTYFRANEATGKIKKFKGQVKSIVANISAENSTGFAEIILGAPYSGYIAKEQFETAMEMARVYRTESPSQLTDLPFSKEVPGLVLNGRAGFVKFLSLHPSQLPSLVYPSNIPLEIKINPLTNQISADQTRVNGSPTLRTVGAIDKDTIGLDNGGALSFGGPDGFASAIERLRAVDLQDPNIRDFVLARAEVLRLRRKIENEYKRIHNIPTIIASDEHIIVIRAGHGDDQNYDSFHNIESCISLLTGKPLEGE